jgi:hypothetical protein
MKEKCVNEDESRRSKVGDGERSQGKRFVWEDQGKRFVWEEGCQRDSGTAVRTIDESLFRKSVDESTILLRDP